ncbi:DMT family transporter [Bermanella sp. WJH001]|mgnify:CR=1 FL=1|uniref:DMT family transporter n=1 Tax=Bermanella sp. WJH001 TaxID=3048005 RepID=UPI0024BDC97D|nr:DMT family transporter [Bermanella sp. WJH001]MDJ1537834.1 DMT family transporter [Bermanella sp. WJH001]
MTSQFKLGLGLALVASFMFSLKPILIKEAYALGANSEGLMVLRMWFAFPFYLALLIWQYPQLASKKRYIASAVATGFLGYFLSSYLDLLALESISAHAERIILYAYPSLVVLIKAAWDKKMPSKNVLFAVVIVYAGLIVLLPGEFTLHGSWLGLMLMLSCAVTFAIYVLLSKPLIEKLGAGLFTSIAMVSSCLFTQVNLLNTPIQAVLDYSWSIYGYGFALAFFSTVIPSYAMSAAIARIGSERTAITGTTGPLFTTLLAVWILGETLTGFHLAGLGLVILGVFLISKPISAIK